MPYKIYLKKSIQNEISNYKQIINKVTTVNDYTVVNGFLVKNNLAIPIDHILFIEEI